MTALERRCRWLLRAYPAWYRAERGEEMLATLLEASRPGAQWPSPRDTRALIMGGLRVRAWGNQRPGMAASLHMALLLGVSVALLWYFSHSLCFDVATVVLVPGSAPDMTYQFATAILGLAVVTATWFAPRRDVVIALACVATWLVVANWQFHGNRIIGNEPAGLLILLGILMYGGRRLPRSWLWLALVIIAPGVLLHITGLTRLNSVLLYRPLEVAPWIILGAIVLWAVVDPRPAIAMAVWITVSYPPYLPSLVFRTSPYVILTWQWYLPAIGAAVVAAAAIWRLRRQAAL
jgi:hypothetical protein